MDTNDTRPMEPSDALPAASGRCTCGDVVFSAQLPPRFVTNCHCENCRRAHGAAFVTWVGFEDGRYALDDVRGSLRHFATDTGARRSFCSRCGTPIAYSGPRWPGEIHLPLALFEVGHQLAPSGHVYADRAPSWCPITDHQAQRGGATGVEPL